jgi:hypothetical protein
MTEHRSTSEAESLASLLILGSMRRIDSIVEVEGIGDLVVR